MFTFADLFAGIGGFRLALEKLGGKCVFSCEINKNARKVYIENFNDELWGDIRDINEKRIPKFDILCAGFPCQPFSISGKGLGFNDPKNGDLFFHIVRIAKEIKPKALILENVKNFRTHNNGETFKTAKKLLEDLGYEVFSKVLNAKYFGLAQNRERLFIVAIRKEFGDDFKFSFPKNTKIIAVEDILDEEPSENLFYRGEKGRVKILKPDLISKVHKPYQIAYVNSGRQGERIYSVKGLSITISHSTGGIFSKTGAYWTKEGIRKLSVSECKRLFGFPEEFSFSDLSESNSISLLGNSVPVNVVEEISKNLLKVLEIPFKEKSNGQRGSENKKCNNEICKV